MSEFKRANLQYQADHPTEVAYTDTGTVEPTSIQRYNNGEDADHDVLRRPIEQNRRRIQHLSEEQNLHKVNSAGTRGVFLEPGATRVTWHGTTASPAVNSGVFELTASLWFQHPLYPDTQLELQAATIGNASSGFFSTEANRLKEEGDSIFITFGVQDSTPAAVEALARTTTGVSSAITQGQLRKGPTWVLLSDVSTNLSTAPSPAVVPGSDKVRIYYDPIGSPMSYKLFTIQNLVSDGTAWYIEVGPTTPFWDSTTSPTIPPAGTNKLFRASGAMEYEIVETTDTTVKLSSRSFSGFYSNLFWQKAGTNKAVYGVNTSGISYRENEWQFALPLAMVSGGVLVFPLAGAGAVPPFSTTTHSISGLMHTALSDIVTAAHPFKNAQSCIQAAGNVLQILATDSTVSGNGRGDIRETVAEAHTDGTTGPSYWTAHARPGVYELRGAVDGHNTPFVRCVEQG